MDERLNKFKQIIREGVCTNTYKMALAKALVELSSTVNYEVDPVTIPVSYTAWKFLKYYWNQTIFFDLVQGSDLKKPPEIYQYTKELIEKYFEATGTRKPEKYERIEEFLL